MTVFEANKACLRNYIEFSGRAARSEFWKFILFQFLVMILLMIVNSILFGPSEISTVKVSVGSDGIPVQSLHGMYQYNSGWLGTIYGFAMLIPTLSAAWRRMHDSGKPGWYALIPIPVGLMIAAPLIYFSLTSVAIDPTTLPDGVHFPTSVSVPEIGWMFFTGWLIGMGSIIVMVYWLAKKSQPGPNKYGPNPNEVTQ